MLKIVYFYQAPLLRIAAGTASPFITSRPMTTVKAAFFSLSTTIQMIATSEIRISVSKYWILSIINQALSKTEELPEIESRYFASEEEFRSLLASRQFIKAVILTDVCRYRFYAIPKLCIIANSSLCIYLWLFALFEAFFEVMNVAFHPSIFGRHCPWYGQPTQ
jgi:hypothetical protein